MSDFITLGKIMLRLKAPDHERLFQSPILESTFGGGEANVVCGLACFGLDVAFVSVISDNLICDACISELSTWNVNTRYIVRSGDRLGVYFLDRSGVMMELELLVEK